MYDFEKINVIIKVKFIGLTVRNHVFFEISLMRILGVSYSKVYCIVLEGIHYCRTHGTLVTGICMFDGML